MDSYIQFITVLILFVFVLAATYLITRWIAQYQKGKAGTGNLEIVETCRVSANKYVQIIRAGKKYLVVAIGKDEIHMLSELSEEEIDLQENRQEQALDFASVLDRVKKLKDKDKD
ncbi:MAG: flagellar biosynthetic protein FliO [Lachnospiraceae bacterium]|nr:flagellar biosynthetic protein FliO [Lachnospiraceae bacterium]MDE7287667.1 flagellar biosynthetic protein FliO [Lachnospiraceae bacterium]